jgi:cell division protein FtsW (lipid II flippase)
MEFWTTFFDGVTEWFDTFGGGIAAPVCTVLRFVFPLLSLLILVRCARSLLRFRNEPETWALLVLPGGKALPVTHWENLIGRKKSCDLVIDFPTVSRSHAVLTRYDDGSWSIRDVGSKGGVVVNGQEVPSCEVRYGDQISLGGVEVELVPFTAEQEQRQASIRTRAGATIRPGVTLLLLTLLQILAAVQLCLSCGEAALILGAFAALMGLEWALFLVQRAMHRTGYDVETIAFYLTTIGMAIGASDDPSGLPKMVLTIAMGLTAFLVIGWALRDLERAKKIRYLAAAGGIALLALNLLFGTEQYGAKNWIYIGSMSFQPSELVKICFVFVGASTLDRIVARRNVALFLVYTGVVCGALALMNDFGTAVIFFCAFLVIAFLRSGNFASLALICAGVAFAGALALRFRPYALARFAAWRHVWENALSSGYQQTRAMMCIASGGLFGLGLGNGWLKYVAASDTDLVFAFVGEEWGLLVAVMMVLAVACLGAFTVKSASTGRSSFYTIGACAAMCILMVQAILNVFGTVDFLPLTGVTFPFVSNGGSSMISAWGLLAFIKAADTRQNASFAVRLSGQTRVTAEEDAA